MRLSLLPVLATGSCLLFSLWQRSLFNCSFQLYCLSASCFNARLIVVLCFFIEMRVFLLLCGGLLFLEEGVLRNRMRSNTYSPVTVVGECPRLGHKKLNILSANWTVLLWSCGGRFSVWRPWKLCQQRAFLFIVCFDELPRQRCTLFSRNIYCIERQIVYYRMHQSHK